MQELDVDFDDMLKVVQELADLEYRSTIVSYELASFRAKLADKARADKLPQNYIEKVVFYIGLSESDAEHISRLVAEQAQLKKQTVLASGLLDIMRDKIRVWQTKSANVRKL